MGAFLGPIIGGAAGLIGDLANSGFAAGQVQQQEDFQKHMADTQYQRGVADMRAAGLNPALMYGSGSPAPSPSGAMSQAQPFSAVGALQSALQLSTMGASVAQAKAEALNSVYKGQQILSQTDLNTQQATLAEGNATKILHEIKGIDASTAKTAAEAENVKAIRPSLGVTGSETGGVLNLVKQGAGALAPLLGAAAMFF